MGLRCGAISGEEPANSGNCLAGRGRNRIAQNPTPQVIDSNMQDLMDLTTKALLPQAVRSLLKNDSAHLRYAQLPSLNY
jgi:hypothetical protein